MEKKGDGRRHSNYTTGRVQRSPSSLSLSLPPSELLDFSHTLRRFTHERPHRQLSSTVTRRRDAMYAAHRGRRDGEQRLRRYYTREATRWWLLLHETNDIQQLRGGDTRRTADKGELHRGRFARSPLHASSISLSPLHALPPPFIPLALESLCAPSAPPRGRRRRPDYL